MNTFNPVVQKDKYILVYFYFIVVLFSSITYLYLNINIYIMDAHLSTVYLNSDNIGYNVILKNINSFQNYILSNFKDKTSLSIMSYMSSKTNMLEISNEVSIIQMLIYDTTKCSHTGAFHFI